jgi:hypothetical protein
MTAKNKIFQDKFKYFEKGFPGLFEDVEIYYKRYHEYLSNYSNPLLSGPEILSSIIDKFLENSQCATENKQKLYLYILLGNKKLVTTLLYRGSDHGWKYIDFHSRCDNKGPTISLFKVEEGDCIGGFT